MHVFLPHVPGGGSLKRRGGEWRRGLFPLLHHTFHYSLFNAPVRASWYNVEEEKGHADRWFFLKLWISKHSYMKSCALCLLGGSRANYAETGQELQSSIIERQNVISVALTVAWWFQKAPIMVQTSNCLIGNALLIRQIVRAEWIDWFDLTGNLQ